MIYSVMQKYTSARVAGQLISMETFRIRISEIGFSGAAYLIHMILLDQDWWCNYLEERKS